MPVLCLLSPILTVFATSGPDSQGGSRPAASSGCRRVCWSAFNYATIACSAGHSFRQVADAQAYARAHVEEGQIIDSGLPVLQRKHRSFAEVIDVQEFARRYNATPSKSQFGCFLAAS